MAFQGRGLARIVARWGVALSLFLASVCNPLHAASYVYDSNGRLCAVTNSAGDSSQYVYDALGNLIRVASVTSGQLAVFAFTPNRGPIGAPVTIYGAAFSTTPANNTVKFNGVTASVGTATATQLTVTVPASATTGKISVTVASITATSTDDFFVTAAEQAAPTITGFSPSIATAGTAVTVTGTNLQPLTGLSTLRVSTQIVAPSAITSISNTQIVFTVPSAIGSGKISVMTPFGLATSANLLIVTPTGIATTDVISSAHLVPGGGSGSLNINTANKAGVFTFDSANDVWLSLQISSITITGGPNVPYKLYSPTNTQILSSQGSVSATSPTIHLPKLTAVGTYALYFQPGAASTQLTAALEYDATLTKDGSALALVTSVTSQSKRAIFTGIAGQNVGVGLSGTLSTGTLYQSYAYTPDGAALTNKNCYTTNSGCELDLLNLPVSGLSSIVVKPGSAATMNMSATLSSEATGTLVSGTPFSVSLSRAGQNGRYSFAGTAGANVGLQIASVATLPTAGTNLTYSVFKPDGTALPNATGTYVGYKFFNLTNLPVTGTYTVFVNPDFAATVTLQMTLTPPSALTVDGSAIAVTTTAQGQSAYFQFAGTTGQNLGLGFSSLSLTPTSVTYFQVFVYKPDGTTQQSTVNCYTANAGCELDLLNLPATGNYTVVATPGGAATMGLTATLSSEVTTTLVANTPYSASLSRAGQNARLSFAGTAATNVGLQFASVSTTPSGKNLNYTVYKPDGTALSGGSGTYTGTIFFNLMNLPTTGTYTVFIDPDHGSTASLQATLATPSTLTVDSSAVVINTGTQGHSGYMQFAGTSGQKLGLGFTVATTPSSVTQYTAYVYKPDGTSLSSKNCTTTNGGCEIDMFNLPSTGNYTVVVTPAGAATMALTTTLSSEATGTLVADTAFSVSLSRTGQNGRYSFSGTAATYVGLQVTTVATTPSSKNLTYTVYKPDGTALSNGTGTTTGHLFLNLANLPTTGTYTVLVNPEHAATVTLQMTLTTPTTLAIDGSSVAVSTSAQGQSGHLQVSGTAGQNLGLGFTSMSFVPTSVTYFQTFVYKPDGTTQQSTVNCTASNGGCELDLVNLPTTGTYTIVTTPGGAATMAHTTTLSSDLTGTLTLGNGATITVTRSGQNARYTFSGTQNDTLKIAWSSVSWSPTSASAALTVYQPSGASIATATINHGATGSTNLPTLPATGTYTVFVDPVLAATGSLVLTLSVQ